MGNFYAINEPFLSHHGISGQKWGVRNGPPYPLKGGSYSKSEKKTYTKKRGKNSTHNKKHIDEVISKGTILQTYSRDKNRTSNDLDYFYATHTSHDKMIFSWEFDDFSKEKIYDENGNLIGESRCFNWRINNKLLNDMNVASEDSGADAFMKLYENNRDFYNFVKDPNRMEAALSKGAVSKHKGYAEAYDKLEEIRNKESITEEDLRTVYRIFNYTLPSDGHGNEKLGHDVAVQRAKFFKELKSKGYGAVLDTNDALYGGFAEDGTRSPVIVFDKSSIIPDSIRRENMADKALTVAKYSGMLMSLGWLKQK